MANFSIPLKEGKKQMIIGILDLISLILVSIAILLILVFWSKILKRNLRLILLGFLIIIFIFYLSNFLEWMNISTVLVPYEDLISILAPVFWFLFIYVYIQNKNRENILKRKTMESFYKDLLIHDVKNIFQIIGNTYELIDLEKQKNKKIEEIYDLINILNEQIVRGKFLTSNVYNLSKLESEDIFFKEIDVCKFLKESINIIKNSFKNRQINIDITNSFQTYSIEANELLLDVFENILLNAIKHNNNDVIEIKIVALKVQKDHQKYIHIEFIDNGVGIPDSRKKIIFQRRGNIGKIWVENRVEGDYSKGSKFIIELPKKRKY
ncbi:MAG: HAMP domain-containing sensor histidine kinase [Candidatus Lokiarchaeota archaeon]